MNDPPPQDDPPAPTRLSTTPTGAVGPTGRRADMNRTIPIQDAARLQEQIRDALRQKHLPAVEFISGPEVGRRLPLAGTTVFGRDPAADVVILDRSVSWRHARIEDRGDAWAVVDLGSTNGTAVNGNPCRDAVLAAGDKVSLGTVVLRFELNDPVEQAYDLHIERLLDIDDLSGLFVRRRFDRDLAASVDQARTFSGRVGLLVMDMDGIKQINDTHGHLFGAYTIGETGRVIARVIGDRGTGSRFGGDEFCVCLPGFDRARSFAVAVEIHAAVNTHAYVHDGIPLRPGISIGVAAFPEDAADPTALFQRADEALYRAKRSGKNRICG
jgi:diguanylate cyclase (GGDEF)-like protein